MYRSIRAVKQLLLLAVTLGVSSSHLSARQQDSISASSTTGIPREAGPKVTGTIKDASTGRPLDGVNVSVPGFSAAITDEKGSFSINVPNLNSSLLIEGQGYHSRQVALKGKNAVSAGLYESSFPSQYDEVYLPYQKKMASYVAGAVKSVSVYDRWNRHSGESADSYLQGRVAGLNAVRRSGTPGIGASMFLRGISSLNTSSQPLIVVDGMIYDNTNFGTSLISGHVDNPLANIDLRDIDNITVVKDATASSFGVKAANGVIFITTSREKDQATKIDFGAYGGFNSRPASIPLMGASDFRVYLSDILGRYRQSLGFNAVEAQQYVYGQKYMIDDPANPDYFRFHYNTDWQDEVFSNSYNQNYYMKVTGGDNIATYGLSVGYLNNKGVTQNTNLERYQTRFNADLNFTSKFKGNANLSFISNRQDLKDQGLSTQTNPLLLALTKSPFLPVHEVSDQGVESPNFADADVLGRSNPVALINNMDGTNNNYRFIGSVGFTYKFSNNLSANALGGVTYSKVRENIFVPEKGVVSDTLSNAVAYNRSGTNVERLYSLFTDLRLSYVKSFNSIHHLSANGGFRYNTNKMEADYGLGYNSATDDYVTIGNGQDAMRRVSGENGKWNWLNIYANADYDYLNKYFLSLNLAMDGSSRFGKTVSSGLDINGARFAMFPSVGAAWLVSSESFFSEVKAVDLLKLRLSYGTVGNDDIGNYTAKQFYVSQNLLGTQGLVRGNVANTSLKWETVEKLNAGVDVALLNERLSLSFDAFRHITHDMLTIEAIPTVSGFSYALTNNGGLRTTGIEVSANGRILNKKLKWDLGVNLSTYRSKITEIPDGGLTSSYAGATVSSRMGLAPNVFWGYKTNGVFSTDQAAAGMQSRNYDGSTTPFQGGDIRFTDLNNDSFIDQNDMTVIGNPNPDFAGMINNTLSWRRFSFDAQLTFSVGNDVYNYMRRQIESMSGFENQTPAVLKRWKTEGQVTDFPRAVVGDPAGNARFSDRWIEDGSYLRLRTASVSYNVPVRAKAIKYARVYLTGNNIFTISKYLGYDPEFSAGSSVYQQGIDTVLEPQFRSVQLGVRIGL